MSAVTIVLELYLGTFVLAGGLTKLDLPSSFTAVLQQHRLPAWCIRIITPIVAWTEITLATLLVSGVLPVQVAYVTVGVFCMFLFYKINLLRSKQEFDCGCFGSTNQQKIDLASVLVSLILLLVSGVHLWLVLHVEPLDTSVRLLLATPFSVITCVLLWRILQRNRIRARQLKGIAK